MEGEISIQNEHVANPLFKARTLAEVASVLGIYSSLISSCLNMSEQAKYSVFTIPKKDSTRRVIYAPCGVLKFVQRRLADVLMQSWAPTPCSYGFLPGKSIVDNSQEHIGKKCVLNIDLEDFFPSISITRLRSLLLGEPYCMHEQAVEVIVGIACFRGSLPQGAPSSPILSNIVAESLDYSLLDLARNNGCSYSRYADDITFSTVEKTFPNAIVASEGVGRVELAPELINAIESEGFLINWRKVTLSRWCNHQEVTGVVVNEKPNVRRQYVSRLRSILHNCQIAGVYTQACRYIGQFGHKVPRRVKEQIQDRDIVERWFAQVLRGKVEYVRMVKGPESPTFYMLASRYNEVFGPTFIVPPLP